MGSLQQGFNQALTGATFLLQQTPGWQQMAERSKDIRQYKEHRKNLADYREQAMDVAKGIEEEYRQVGEPLEKDDEFKRKTSVALKKAKGLEEGMDISVERMQDIIRKDPTLLKKFPGALAADSKRFHKASESLSRIYGELTEQKEQQMQYKTMLKQQHAEELTKLGVSKEAIEKARYN